MFLFLFGTTLFQCVVVWSPVKRGRWDMGYVRLEEVVSKVLSRVSPSVMCREGGLVEGGGGLGG